jgi:hypothetical protein
MDPGYFSGRTALGQDLQSRIGQGLSEDQLAFFANKMNQQQGARGIFDSPLGAAATSRYLTTQDLLAQQRNTENYQNYLNNYQLQPIPQVVPFSGMPGQGFMGGAFTPPSANDTIGLKANLEALGYSNAMQNANQPWQGIGAGISGAMGGATMGSMFGGTSGTGMPGGGGSPYSSSTSSSFGAPNSMYGGQPYWNSNPFSGGF